MTAALQKGSRGFVFEFIGYGNIKPKRKNHGRVWGPELARRECHFPLLEMAGGSRRAFFKPVNSRKLSEAQEKDFLNSERPHVSI